MRTPLPSGSPKDLSDNAIVQRVLGGDRQAFELLMRRFNRVLYRTARSILKDDTEAEDVLQDAYLRAYQSLSSFRGDASLTTWLTRIVINEALARLRKSARRATIIDISGETQWDNQAAEVNMDGATVEQPDQSAVRAQTRRLIEAKIDALPDAFRTVFMLRALEEMSVEETAACLDIPEATVRSRYFRARGLLREALAREVDHSLETAFAFDGARCDRIVAATMARIHAGSGAASSDLPVQ